MRRWDGRLELTEKHLPGGGQAGLLLIDDADGTLQLRREAARDDTPAAAAQHRLRQDGHAEVILDQVQDRVVVGHAVLDVDLRVAREQVADAAAAAPLLQKNEGLSRELIDLKMFSPSGCPSGSTASMVS